MRKATGKDAPVRFLVLVTLLYINEKIVKNLWESSQCFVKVSEGDVAGGALSKGSLPDIKPLA